jgi:uncharacterized protein YoxC
MPGGLSSFELAYHSHYFNLMFYEIEGLMRFFTTLCVLLIGQFSLVACQQASQLNDMHDQTARMADTTSKLLDATNKMNQTTQNMNGQTSQMLEQTKAVNEKSGQMKESMDAMTEDLKLMIAQMKELSTGMKSMDAQLKIMVPTLAKMLAAMGKMVRQMKTLPELDSEMKRMVDTVQGLCAGSREALAMQAREQASVQLQHNADHPLTKVERAAEYLQGFEYQAWGLCGEYNLHERENLMAAATEEFFLHLHDLTSSSTQASPLSSIKKVFAASADADKDNDFNALAASLSEVNDLQLGVLSSARAKGQKFKVENMQNIIKEALTSQRLRDSGKIRASDIPDYQTYVLNFRPLAIRILQARSNILRAQALQTLLGATQMDLLGLHQSGPLVLDLQALKLDQLIGKFGILELLAQARVTDQILTDNKEPLAIDPALRLGFMTLSIKPRGSKATSSAELLKAQAQLSSELLFLKR